MPLGALLVVNSEVLGNVRALLAVTLARLALLDAWALGLDKLPPAAAPLRPLQQPRRKLRGTEDDKEATQRAALRPTLVQVVLVLARDRVDPVVDAHEHLVLVVGVGGERRVEELVHLVVGHLSVGGDRDMQREREGGRKGGREGEKEGRSVRGSIKSVY